MDYYESNEEKKNYSFTAILQSFLVPPLFTHLIIYSVSI